MLESSEPKEATFEGLLALADAWKSSGSFSVPQASLSQHLESISSENSMTNCEEGEV